MKKGLILSLILTAFLFACNQVEVKDKEKTKGNDKEAASKVICMEITYPVTFIMPDGSEISGKDRNEIGAAMRKWHEAYPNIKERAKMKYPVQAIFKGESVTISSEDEMQQMRRQCEEEKDPCFRLEYPVTYIMPDASTITVNSEDDINNRTAIRAWYGENPDAEQRPGFQYPVKVKLRDGSFKTLESDDDLKAVREGCK